MEFLAQQMEAHQHLPHFKVWCLDMAGYDQSICSQILKMSQCVEREWYEECPGSARYWQWDYEHLVETRLVVPWGGVFTKKHGVSSGDPKTSFIGTIACFIIIKTVFNMLAVSSWVYTFGDDVYACTWGSDISLRTFSGAVKFYTGCVVNEKKSRVVGSVRVTPGDSPSYDVHSQFLSTFFSSHNVTVPETKDVLMTLLHPERGLHTPEWEWIRAISALIRSWDNEVLCYHIQRYIDYLREQARIDRALLMNHLMSETSGFAFLNHSELIRFTVDPPSMAELQVFMTQGSWKDKEYELIHPVEDFG